MRVTGMRLEWLVSLLRGMFVCVRVWEVMTD